MQSFMNCTHLIELPSKKKLKTTNFIEKYVTKIRQSKKGSDSSILQTCLKWGNLERLKYLKNKLVVSLLQKYRHKSKIYLSIPLKKPIFFSYNLQKLGKGVIFNKKKMSSLLSAFQHLAPPPVGIIMGAYVAWKDEILVCGSNCYSYHTVKNKYKRICDYPTPTVPKGHVVVELHRNKKEITLLSFGGNEHKHTLLMHYKSVWVNNGSINNKWITAPNNIGGETDNMRNPRAVVGGKDNTLLYVVHKPDRVLVLDIKSFQIIATSQLPLEIFGSICLLKIGNGIAFVNRKHITWIVLDESNMTIQYKKSDVNCDLKFLFDYHGVSTNHFAIFGGGYKLGLCSYRLYVYWAKRKKWKDCSHMLSRDLYHAFVISADNLWLHIFTISSHSKMNLRELLYKVYF
ncbi:hypothetical protein RFI_11247 [Reticulomyxa filosa]|uniref:Uncharacterized protein n=1 Tax=Reticulomyxa filosa TaxID=46433 RepID=X6NJ32_RETFI|nr:hypothetical protein RFI_11247 [Reticulomyxa filosa]|eukprot:ETO25888.1 hypothetical protein RFI_11247 [Reticulomyxa filosa]